MKNNNDFVQKFNYAKKSSNKTILATIFTSFISAIVGAVCAILIYSSIITPNNSNKEAIDTGATTRNK